MQRKVVLLLFSVDKTDFHFQCILKSILQVNYRPLYATMCLYWAVIYVTMQPHWEYPTYLPHSSV